MNGLEDPRVALPHGAYDRKGDRKGPDGARIEADDIPHRLLALRCCDVHERQGQQGDGNCGYRVAEIDESIESSPACDRLIGHGHIVTVGGAEQASPR